MKKNSQTQSFAVFLMTVACLPLSNAEAAVGRIAGEASVNAVGAATYSVPLTLPRGTHGLTPSLSLNYNSGGDNGLLGVGWSIGGLSAISRCGRTWAQEQEARDVRRDASDRFCLDGNKLRLVTGTYGSFGATYKTEIADFSVVTSTNDGSGNQYFVVKARDGLTYEYGFTVDSRVEILGHLSDIRVWALDKVSDPAGNAMVFSYTKQTTGTGADGSYRIASIQYTSSTGVTAPYSVDFTYETKPTSEIDSRYFADGVIKQIRRLDRVDIKYNSSAVRIYDLTYESALSSTSKSRLQSVTQCAATLGDCLPPTTFTYQNGTPGLGSEVVTSISIPAGVTPWAIDVNGDGRDDLVYATAPTSGNWVVQFASASGYVAASGAQPANTNFAQATPIDYDSDGMMDMLVPNSSGTWSVMLGSATGLASPVDTGAPVTTTGKGLNARAFDVDGDGRDDLVWADLVGYTGTGDAIRYRTRLQSGAGFSSAVGVLANYGPDTIFASGVFAPVGQPGPKRVPDFNGDGRGDLYFKATTRNFIDPGYVYTDSIVAICSGGCGPGGQGFAQSGPVTSDPLFGDFNGDGKTDILYYDSAGSFKVRLSTGYSFTNAIVGPSLSPYGRWVIADWDGDGNDDLLARVTSTAKWDVIRFTGEAFATAVPTGLAAGSNTFTIADINGDGLPDLGSTNASGVWTYRLHSGVYPDLLKTVTDGYSNVVTFNYAPLPSANHTPNATLPTFPEQNFHGAINVVTSYSAPDGVGGTYTNTFAYWGAVANLQGRGFEGFEARRVIDSRNGLGVVDHYKQAFPFTGMVGEHNVWRDDLVNLISHTENQVADTTLSATSHEERHFPHVTTSTSDEYEVHPSDPKDHQLITRSVTNYTFDSAGNATNVSTQLTDKDIDSPYSNYFWTTTTQSTFSSTPDGCTGLATQVSVTNTPPASMSLPSIVRTTSYTPNYTQCRFSQIVTEPSNGTYQVTHDLGYDAFGNLTTDTVTAAGVTGTRATSLSYGTDGRFPIQITNALGEHTDMTYDVGLGVPLTITDPNVLTVTLTYDSFGRKTKEQRPDLTSSNWAFANCAPSNCLNGNNQTIVTRTEKNNGGTDLTDELIYLDKLDRPIAASQKLLGTSRNRVELHYDTLGRVSQQSAPCDAASCATYWTTLAYDDANRVIAASRPRKVSDLTLQSTSISYLGRKTIVTDAEGKQSIKIAMVTGWMGRSIDHNSYEQRCVIRPCRSAVSRDAGRAVQCMAVGKWGGTLILKNSVTGLLSWPPPMRRFGRMSHSCACASSRL